MHNKDSNNTDINKLYQKIVDGDRAAYKEVFRLYYDALCRFAGTYIADSQQCEDLVQEAYIKMWEQRSKLGDVKNMKSYLYTMVKNNCINYLVHLKVKDKYAQHFSAEIDILTVEADELNLDGELSVEEKVLTAIEDLPTQCKEVFKKKYLDGMRTKEVAELMNISPRTVEAHVLNALKSLRNRFKDMLPVFLLFLIHKF